VNVSCCCFFVSFCAKQCDVQPHRYYFACAGHSVALKQFSPSSCIQELIRKENYLLTKTYVIYKIYLCNFNVAYRYKNMNNKFLHDILVNWLYIGIRTLLLLCWTITVEPVLKGTCIERPFVYKDHLEIL